MAAPGPDIWTVKRTLDWCVSYLERHGDEKARLSAEWLMGAATGLSRVEVYAYHDKPLSEEERACLRGLLRRRAAGEPLQYVTGETAFRHIVVHTRPGVLIPRPETEMLVELVLERVQLDERKRVLEVGCGTGCVALSVAKETGAHVVATDISADAFECASRNVEALDLSALVELVQTDCVNGVDGPFDALVSNPPYIPSSLIDGLDAEVVGYEPRLALDGGEDGLTFFERLLEEAVPLLADGGLIAFELHEACVFEAARRLAARGFEQVEALNDLAGRPRFICALKA